METTEKHEEKASEILARAVKLLNEAGKAYEANLTLMKEQEALTQDLLHRLELEDLTRDQRAKIARQLGECRRVRRRHKDAAEELHPITFYSEDAQGKRIVRELTALVGELRKIEGRHQNRHYVPRSGRVKGESQDAE